MEKEIIKNCGDFDISFIMRQDVNYLNNASSCIQGFMEINGFENWNHIEAHSKKEELSKKMLKLLLIIQEYNLSEDIYQQANLERGCQLALEHLNTAIIESDKLINEKIKKHEHLNQEREKARKKMELHYDKKVKPLFLKLEKELYLMDEISNQFEDAPKVNEVTFVEDLEAIAKNFKMQKLAYLISRYTF